MKIKGYIYIGHILGWSKKDFSIDVYKKKPKHFPTALVTIMEHEEKCVTCRKPLKKKNTVYCSQKCRKKGYLLPDKKNV